MSKLQEAAKELKAYKEKEDLAETVTLLNRGPREAPLHDFIYSIHT